MVRRFKPEIRSTVLESLLHAALNFAESGGGFLPKMSAAKDGRSQAHMDVLVAFFGRKPPPLSYSKTQEHKSRGLIQLRTHRQTAQRVSVSLNNLNVDKVPDNPRILVPEIHNSIVLRAP